MGWFLDASGIAGVTPERVEQALRQYADANTTIFREALESEKAGTADKLAMRSSAVGVTILFPGYFADQIACTAVLSRLLSAPAFCFSIHDGDLWMYTFFVNGVVMDQFNPLPEYWDDEISDQERREWGGKAAVVAEHWPGVRMEQIENYLVHWDMEEINSGARKAYPDDEYSVGQDWQLVDFMKRLGLSLPEFGPEDKVFHFVKNEQGKNRANAARHRPWWKFWG